MTTAGTFSTQMKHTISIHIQELLQRHRDYVESRVGKGRAGMFLQQVSLMFLNFKHTWPHMLATLLSS